jgi:D-3-phosphoglycerate dehydrogenase
MQKPTLSITIRSFNPDKNTYDQLDDCFNIQYQNRTGMRLNEKQVSLAIANADAVIAGTEPFTKEVLESAIRLKVISRVGIGIDNIDMKTVSERGIVVLTTGAATVQPVAEHTIALIFCVLKKITEYNESMRRREYAVKTASLLQGKNIGIIGIGRIGFRVGEMLHGLGCKIYYFDPYNSRSISAAWNKTESLNELFTVSDVITLHTPAQKNNEPILNAEAFSHCRKGVIIINTARGSLVDEKALFDALDKGNVGGAGLDVTVKEPYDGPLLAFPQVILTPHVASNTLESRSAMEFEAIQNLIQFLGSV